MLPKLEATRWADALSSWPVGMKEPMLHSFLLLEVATGASTSGKCLGLSVFSN
ncbi:hypothetical protein Pint_08195 [Pistacia integerrima]|uniref:Uncharacterized protein n=1 Tax=Pistacia integerrima TaxID=434235 RepID=A0ACC0XVE5_9ROSI|nr:hypothetical protein Pint_08195 [Pistacia integerrima]